MNLLNILKMLFSSLLIHPYIQFYSGFLKWKLTDNSQINLEEKIHNMSQDLKRKNIGGGRSLALSYTETWVMKRYST